MKLVSELRQDLVSGDWVVIAKGRARRPHEFSQVKKPSFQQPQKGCPFEKLHVDALTVYSLEEMEGQENWLVQTIPNKYPALGSGVCAIFHKVGPYQWTEGVGFHEVVVTRDHHRSIAQMADEEVELIVRSYQERYLAMKKDDCVYDLALFAPVGA